MTDKTEIERVLETREGSLNMAAAKLVNAVGGLMHRAVTVTGQKHQEVARRMMVTPGRITQLLAADGNIKVSTLARFMDALGYEVKITAEPKDGSVPSLEQARRRSRAERSIQDPWSAACKMDFGTEVLSGLFMVVQERGEFDELKPTHVHHVPAGLVDFAWEKHWKIARVSDVKRPRSSPTTSFYGDEAPVRCR